MSQWKLSENYQKIAEANREFYSQTADLYESTESCVTDSRLQRMLEIDLDRVLSVLALPVARIAALDACGGSGNISLKLLKRGVNVTLADISPELLGIFKRKAAELGYTPRTVCSEIASYFDQTDRTFDLIIFSSALHHLENIEGVLALAFKRLSPGGVLFSVFDPTARDQQRALTRILLRLDYYGFKVFCQTSDLLPAVRRRLRRILSGSDPMNKTQVGLNNTTAGMLAEYHVDRGIDDMALVACLRQTGYEVVWHERHASCRSKWLSRLVARLGDKTSFKLLLRKPTLHLSPS